LDTTARQYRSRSEIDDAFAALPQEEWFRFRRIEAAYRQKLVGVLKDEIIIETVLRIIDGSEREARNGRNWPSEVEFVPFFTMTMKSIASEWYDLGHPRKRGKGAAPQLVLVDNHGSKQGGDAWDTTPVAADWMKPDVSPEMAMIQNQECEAIMKSVYEAVGDNDNAVVFVEALSEGMPRPEIMDLMEVNDKEYDSLRRFVRRRLNKRFPDGYSS